MTEVLNETEIVWAHESEEDAQRRRRNREVVADYMSRRDEGRLTRYELFDENGVGGLWTTDTGEPVASRGRESLKAHGVWSLKLFPDWVWTDVQINDTQDPDRFWVECDGVGQILFPAYPPGHYENHFLHSFLFRNGKILEQREFANPFQQLKALGIPVPEIQRGGFPD